MVVHWARHSKQNWCKQVLVRASGPTGPAQITQYGATIVRVTRMACRIWWRYWWRHVRGSRCKCLASDRQSAEVSADVDWDLSVIVGRSILTSREISKLPRPIIFSIYSITDSSECKNQTRATARFVFKQMVYVFYFCEIWECLLRATRPPIVPRKEIYICVANHRALFILNKCV